MEMDMSWENWKQTLGEAVVRGKRMGISEEDMTQRAEDIGDFLARNVDPANPQQRVLQELWKAADQGEQETLARVITKMVAKEAH